VLCPDGNVALQSLPSGKARVRASDDLDGLVAAARDLSEDARGVYFALNAVSTPPGRDLAPRVAHIVRPRWLLVDVDPVRPADTNSPGAEHDAAGDRAGLIAFRLAGEGWPMPIQADSGNGTHLYYRIDLPVDQKSQSLLRRVLRALAARFDTDEGKLDTKVHN